MCSAVCSAVRVSKGFQEVRGGGVKKFEFKKSMKICLSMLKNSSVML